MKIYTGSGDDGDTTRADGRRVRKSDSQIEAVGAIDELNAHIGLCVRAAGDDAAVRGAIERVQAELFVAGATLARVEAGQGATLDDSHVARIEQRIDAATQSLDELTHFILPGGCELACRLHVARTVCRRAERTVVAVTDAGAGTPPIVLRYLNRLSDLLCTLARLANHNAGSGDVAWTP